MDNEIYTSMKKVLRMLLEMVSLHEETEHYNKVPKGMDEDDIWDYMNNRLLEVREEIMFNIVFHGEEALGMKLMQIVDETECFMKTCNLPGVVTRWKEINPRLLFFDVEFALIDLMEESPESHQTMKSLGVSDETILFYKSLDSERKQYFLEAKKKIEAENHRYSEDRVLQDELQRTLFLIFKHDFEL